MLDYRFVVVININFVLMEGMPWQTNLKTTRIGTRNHLLHQRQLLQL